MGMGVHLPCLAVFAVAITFDDVRSTDHLKSSFTHLPKMPQRVLLALGTTVSLRAMFVDDPKFPRMLILADRGFRSFTRLTISARPLSPSRSGDRQLIALYVRRSDTQLQIIPPGNTYDGHSVGNGEAQSAHGGTRDETPDEAVLLCRVSVWITKRFLGNPTTGIARSVWYQTPMGGRIRRPSCRLFDALLLPMRIFHFDSGFLRITAFPSTCKSIPHLTVCC